MPGQSKRSRWGDGGVPIGVSWTAWPAPTFFAPAITTHTPFTKKSSPRQPFLHLHAVGGPAADFARGVDVALQLVGQGRQVQVQVLRLPQHRYRAWFETWGSRMVHACKAGVKLVAVDWERLSMPRGRDQAEPAPEQHTLACPSRTTGEITHL